MFCFQWAVTRDKSVLYDSIFHVLRKLYIENLPHQREFDKNSTAGIRPISLYQTIDQISLIEKVRYSSIERT